MKSKIREYVEGQILAFLTFFVLTSVLGLILVFIINPIFFFLKTGQVVFIHNMDYIVKIVRMTVACAFSVSVVVFNINWFKGEKRDKE